MEDAMSEYKPVEPLVPTSIKQKRCEEILEETPEEGGILTMWRRVQADVIGVVGQAQCACEVTVEEFVALIRQEWERQRVEQELTNQGVAFDYECPQDRIIRLRGCACKFRL